MGRLVLLAAVLAVAAAKPDPLLTARQFYSQGQYDQAIQAAEPALANPSTASSAHLILGRSRLERYRSNPVATDLDAARADLRAVDPHALDPREKLEFQIGLAVLLYCDDRYGAAAELLDPVIDATTSLAPDAHDRALDWWATALDRQAQALASPDRQTAYARLIARMEQELRRNTASVPAGYWIAAASRGAGDLDRAWAAACAAWLRAPLAGDRATALRADIDKLVTQAIIPERAARSTSRDRRQAAASMTADWEAFKNSWSQPYKP